ncbi:IclR family transcriptional regulator [Nitrincola alkalisediminis]|uniref:IclR family transcriptional regulator n=1 Tax=Nitrincola alkalisediminis TaxID=1366656 RepID=UPI001FE973E0|nr:IclR family transcriptional regulator [Nitrincola alkalisediminis]
MLNVLDIFSPDRLVINVEDIAQQMSLSRATAYRYVKELCDVGLLSRVDGNYTLGPRIIELDWMMRKYDPLISTGREMMAELAITTGLTVYLSVYYDGHIINTHIESAQQKLGYAFGRGRPLPLFKGAQSKVLISFQKANRLKRIYEEMIQDNPEYDLSWKEFNQITKTIRKDGYSLTHDELNLGLTGISAPILNPKTDDILGSLALVGSSTAFELFNQEALISRLKEVTAIIGHKAQSL